MISINNTTRFLFAVLWAIITYIECYGYDVAQNTQQNMTLVSWIILSNLVMQAFTLYWCKISLVSFFFAFVFFYYIFHFGQVFAIGLFPYYELDYLNYVEVYMTDNVTLDNTIRLCIVSINAFFIGGLFAKNDMSKSIIQHKSSSYPLIIKQMFFLLLHLD